jgi:hypothetical protein
MPESQVNLTQELNFDKSKTSEHRKQLARPIGSSHAQLVRELAEKRAPGDVLVRVAGLEPAHHFWREILSLLCLPISPYSHDHKWFSIVRHIEY